MRGFISLCQIKVKFADDLIKIAAVFNCNDRNIVTLKCVAGRVKLHVHLICMQLFSNYRGYNFQEKEIHCLTDTTVYSYIMYKVSYILFSFLIDI